MSDIPDELPNMANPRDHLDRIRLIVRISGMPTLSRADTSLGMYAVWADSLAVPLEDATRYASAVAWNQEHSHFEAFVTDQRYTQFEWGASGTALEFAIEVVEGVAVDSILLGMGYAIAKMRGHTSGKGRQEDLLRPTEEVTSLVLEATATIFDVDEDTLKIAKITAKDGETTAIVKGRGRRRFVATVKRLDSGDPVIVVAKKRQKK